MAETNQVKWVGVRPVSPEEDIPVKTGAAGLEVSVKPISPAQSIPVVKGTDERKAAAITPATKVTVTSAGVTLLAANSARVSFLIRNTGSVDIYVRLGSTPTTNDMTLEPGDAIAGDDCTGIITGIVASTSGEVRVIEV